ncbi:MAG: TRAP transporter substrate-binding protein [Rhodocyclaceae bacterium]|nr:TRAP transporter substrate-binding protein [Rhodocyclaceae bacterium]
MKIRYWFLALMLPFTLLTAQAQDVTLKVSHFLPPGSNIQQGVLEPWCAKIAKESNGRLKCQLYPAMQLGGTPAQLVDQVKNGVADIVWTSPAFSTGRFPRIEAVELPFVMPADGLPASRAIWDFYEQHAREDFADYKVLAIHSGGCIVMDTANRPMLTLADFAGEKLRSGSRMASRLLIALGGTPVNMPPPQITDAVTKGVVDGAMAAWELVPSVKLEEVTKFHTESPLGEPGFSSQAMSLLMNKKKYESLPADLKAVIDRNSGAALVEAAGIAWDKATDAARKKALARGNTVIVIKSADYAPMRKAGASVEQEWIKELSGKGLDGAKLVKAAHEIGARHTR